MKKITFLLTLLIASATVNAQAVFEDDFDGSGPGISGWTVVDVDARVPNSSIAGVTPTGSWVQRDNGGNMVATSTSWYTPAGQSDDWLITPAITLTAGTSPSLIWTGRAIDPSYPDGYEVRISTTGIVVPGDFGTTLFSVAAENSSATGMIHTVDLSTYAGQTVYIAWRNNSVDQFLLDIDNVFVGVPTGNPPPAPIMPTPADMATAVAISTADVNMDGAPDYSLDFLWSLPLGGSASSYEFFFGTDPTALASITTSATPDVGLVNLQYNTTYYWQVIATNQFGQSMNNPIWSFTTEGTTILPPGNASSPMPADGATNVMIDTNNTDSVAFAWTPSSSGDPATSTRFDFGTDPMALNSLGSLGAGASTVTLNNILPNTTYYWRLVERNPAGNSPSPAIWSFTTESTASVNDAVESLFILSPNPTTDVLNIQSDEIITAGTIYNGLGQVIQENVNIENNIIKVNRLSAGLYLLKLDTDKGSQTVQFIKK